MYFPYLRGKQFELIALRELAARLGESGKISPVIEPVKETFASLDKSIQALVDNNVNFNIIINPIVGDMVDDNTNIINFIKSKLEKYNNFQVGIIITQYTNLDSIDYYLNEINHDLPLTIIHLGRPNDLDSLASWSSGKNIKYNLYGENIPIRRYRDIVSADSRVLLENNFIAQPRNVDYENNPDEFFSDEHLFYKEDGLTGFSDYLTNGVDYQDSGFLPFAVAIHFTYIDRKDNAIRIRHFISDSNSDNTDVPGKYGEALNKLINFIQSANITTESAREFQRHFDEGRYAGLGSIKKLSIKNHIELLLELLN